MKHTATPHTMAEKILMRHTGLSDLKPGDLVVVRPDYAVCHDIYTENYIKGCRKCISHLSDTRSGW